METLFHMKANVYTQKQLLQSLVGTTEMVKRLYIAAEGAHIWLEPKTNIAVHKT